MERLVIDDSGRGTAMPISWSVIWCYSWCC